MTSARPHPLVSRSTADGGHELRLRQPRARPPVAMNMTASTSSASAMRVSTTDVLHGSRSPAESSSLAVVFRDDRGRFFGPTSPRRTSRRWSSPAAVPVTVVLHGASLPVPTVRLRRRNSPHRGRTTWRRMSTRSSTDLLFSFNLLIHLCNDCRFTTTRADAPRQTT